MGEPTSTAKIPTDHGPLYNVWLHWRNRAWAEATERFRVELRKQKPDVVVLANTQYLRAAPDLATDLQYGHEDVVLSESRDKSADQLVDKPEVGLSHAPVEPARHGNGKVVVMTLPAPWDDVSEWLRPARFMLEPRADASILPYVDRNGQLVVYVCADRPLPDALRVTACDGVSGRAIICSPDQPQPRIIDLVPP